MRKRRQDKYHRTASPLAKDQRVPDIAFYRLFTDGHVGDVQNLPRSTFFLRLRLPKKEGRDYTGHVPRLLGDPAPTTYVHGVLEQELLLSTRQALIIPPSKCLSGALQVLLADRRWRRLSACSVSRTCLARTDSA